MGPIIIAQGDGPEARLAAPGKDRQPPGSSPSSSSIHPDFWSDILMNPCLSSSIHSSSTHLYVLRLLTIQSKLFRAPPWSKVQGTLTITVF